MYLERGEQVLKILFWDIDGTLIRTAKAGLYAFEQAVTEVYCREIDFSALTTSGMTDNHIASQIIQQLQEEHSPSRQDIVRLTQRYEELLPQYLEANDGFILPSVTAILEALQAKENYVLLLLTGNSRRGAEIKLKYFDLAKYFDFAASAFCEHCLERNDIAWNAMNTVSKKYPTVPLEDVFIIGDTPNDIACGKVIGAKTIAVATGNYPLESLTFHSPWWALEQLPSPEEFIQGLNKK